MYANASGNLAEMISRELERESLLARALGGEEATTLRQLRAFESLQESVLIIDTAKSSWPVGRFFFLVFFLLLYGRFLMHVGNEQNLNSKAI